MVQGRGPDVVSRRFYSNRGSMVLDKVVLGIISINLLSCDYYEYDVHFALSKGEFW